MLPGHKRRLRSRGSQLGKDTGIHTCDALTTLLKLLNPQNKADTCMYLKKKILSHVLQIKRVGLWVSFTPMGRCFPSDLFG